MLLFLFVSYTGSIIEFGLSLPLQSYFNLPTLFHPSHPTHLFLPSQLPCLPKGLIHPLLCSNPLLHSCQGDPFKKQRILKNHFLPRLKLMATFCITAGVVTLKNLVASFCRPSAQCFPCSTSGKLPSTPAVPHTPVCLEGSSPYNSQICKVLWKCHLRDTVFEQLGQNSHPELQCSLADILPFFFSIIFHSLVSKHSASTCYVSSTALGAWTTEVSKTGLAAACNCTLMYLFKQWENLFTYDCLLYSHGYRKPRKEKCGCPPPILKAAKLLWSKV